MHIQLSVPTHSPACRTHTHTSLGILVSWNVSTWEAAAGVPGYPLAFKEFKANLGYLYTVSQERKECRKVGIKEDRKEEGK